MTQLPRQPRLPTQNGEKYGVQNGFPFADWLNEALDNESNQSKRKQSR